MATKSILKNIVINNKKDADNFINALEKSKNRKDVEVKIKQNVIDVNKKDIKKILGIK